MKFSEHLTYYALSSVCTSLSLLPLRVLYILSDFLAWLAGSVVKYRRHVIHDNLSSSFPEKEEKEIKLIEKKFYKFLADYFFETIKLATMSNKFINQHVKWIGLDKVNMDLEHGKNCTVYLGHYCNWEWVSSLPIHLTAKCAAAQIYHPLNNRGADKFFYKLRTRFNSHNVAMEDTLRTLIGFKKAGIPTITGYIADQAPGFYVHLFVNFLNHDTGVYTGPERISRFLDANVFYLRCSRPKRGYYTFEFVPITDDVNNEPTFGPSKRYFELLEENIRQQPELWLWSHRRWKRSREMFMNFFGDKAEEQLSHL